jgi:PAS domain S-box-containing protein
MSLASAIGVSSPMNTPLKAPHIVGDLDADALHDLIDGVGDFVQSVLPDGRIRFVNAAWCRRLGYSRAEALGMSIFEVIHPDSLEHCQHYFGRLMAGEDVGLMEVVFRTKSGEPVYLEGRVTVRFEHGAPASTRGVLREVPQPRASDATLVRFREQRRLFHSVLSILRANTARDRAAFLASVTRSVAQALHVARASVWLFDHDRCAIVCESLFADGSSQGRTGGRLLRGDHPEYFAAIESLLPVRANDARTHPATASFCAGYLEPLGIASMLDSPIRLGSELAGVLCCEAVGEPRHWTNEEEEFLLAVSAIVLIFLETERRTQAEAELNRLNAMLAQGIEEQTAELARSERRLAYLLDSSPVALYTCAATEPYAGTSVSSNIEDLLGYPAQRYLDDATFWSDRLHPEDAPGADAAFARVLREGRASFEYRFRCANGQYRWMRDHYLLVHDADGAPLEMVGSCLDIHDRRLAEQAARNSENDLRRLIETANAPIFGKDIAGRVNEWNRSAERLTGFTRAEVLGCDLVDFVHPSHQDAVRKVLDRALGGDETENFEFPLVAKDGREVLVLLNAGTRRNADGEITGMVGVGQDITALRQADQRSLRAKRLESLGTLAGGVAHDINNALAPILLASGLLRRQAPDSARLIDILESSARRGAAMVQQLLTFAKGVDGERVRVPIDGIIAEVESIVGSTFPKNIALSATCPDAALAVVGDATQIHQVLVNLCVNARDAMPEGGRLALRAYARSVSLAELADLGTAEPGRYVVIEVTDTGCGIAPELQERIFEPFFSTKSPDKGTGLGLSTALGIVRSHRGFMRAASAPGGGTTCSVYLPAAPPSSDPAPRAQANPELLGCGETILVVEDEPAVREVFRQLLQANGFKVRTASDGVAAMEVVSDASVHLDGVITDLHMPNMDGVELAREIARVRPGLGVILSSGRIDRSESAGLASLGFAAQIEKPFTIQRLAEAMRVLLRR